eukprot:Gb_15319 [translate_table: standard]
MPRLSERARDDLSNIGAWWFFKDHTVIRVEGLLTVPHKLPMHIPDRLVAFEVASQCLLGVAGKCKRASQKPYPHIPFSIGDIYFQTWPTLAKFGKEMESMDLPGRVAMRRWDPFDRVRGHLASLKDKMSQEYYHEKDEQEDRFYLNPSSWEYVLQRMQEADDAYREREDADDTEEALTRNILKGLSTKDAMILDPPEAETEHSPETQTPSHQVPPLKEASLPAEIPNLAPPPADPVDKTPPQDLEVEHPPEHHLTRGIRVSSLVSLKTPVYKSPALPLVLRSPHTSLAMKSSMAPSGNPAPTTSDILNTAASMHLPKFPKGGRSEWFSQQLAEAEATVGVVMKPPKVILEYDRATSSLKKITRRKVKIGSQVSTIQTEENVLSLTRKRKRGTRSKELGDEELAADPVSIVRSANRMTEEAVERMHLELMHEGVHPGSEGLGRRYPCTFIRKKSPPSVHPDVQTLSATVTGDPLSLRKMT